MNIKRKYKLNKSVTDNREFGNSDVVELIDIKLEQILKGMVRNKILYTTSR